MSELPQDPENPHRRATPGVPSGPDSSAEDLRPSQAAGGGEDVDEDTEEIEVVGSSAVEDDLDGETILEPIVREGLEAAETRERVGPPKPPPAPQPPRVPPGRAAPVETAGADQPTALLEGEAETLPLDLPFSLRPRSDEDPAEGEDSGDVGRWSRRYYLVWSSVGCLLGLLTFLYVSFAPSSNLEPIFPPIEIESVAMAPTVAPADAPDSRGPLEDLYILTEGDSRISVYDISQRPPRRVGSFESDPELVASRLSFIGNIRIDGFFMVAGVSQGRVWWRPIETDEPMATVTLDADFEIPFPPLTIENWNAQQMERFVVAGHDEAEGFLLSIDPLALRGDRRYQFEDNFVAPIVSIFDPTVGSGRGCLLVVGSKGVSFIDSTGSEFRPFGTAEFAEPWPVDQEGAIKRMRLGGTDRGWLIATAGRYAIVQYSDQGPRLIAQDEFDTSEDAPQGFSQVVTFPDGNDPERDIAFVLHPSGGGAWIELGSDGVATVEQVALPGRPQTVSIATDDLDGDGFWDLIGIEDDGRLWVVDGATRQEVVGGLINATPHEVWGEVIWSQTPTGLECIYPSVDEKWVTLKIPCSVDGREDLRALLKQDWKWRTEATSFIENSG